MNLLEYTFFQHALAGSLLASILCGLIGTYIVTRRLVFISGGITHASFGGIGLGVFMGLPPLLSAAMVQHPAHKIHLQWLKGSCKSARMRKCRRRLPAAFALFIRNVTAYFLRSQGR